MPSVLEKVISGGQTGVDRAGWRAAAAFGFRTGGWMPKGWKAEDGPRPDFEELYGAREHDSPDYPPRTLANVQTSDGTIWLGAGDSRGYGCTRNACRQCNAPVFVVTTQKPTPQEFAEWIVEHQIRVLNVAGNRESSSPGIGAKAYIFLTEAFRLLPNL